MKYLKDIPINIKQKELLKILKMKQASEEKLPGNLKKIIDEEIERGISLAKPEGLYTFKRVTNHAGESVEIEGGISLNENTFKNYMLEIEEICFALVTIGPAIEEESERLQKGGEYTRSLILDAVGSVAVEDAAENLNHILCRKYMGKISGISKRFSPGYGKFPVQEQEKISKVLPFEKLGVKLTNSYMMVPQKSISFCFYTGKLKKEIPGMCEICGTRECPYRGY